MADVMIQAVGVLGIIALMSSFQFKQQRHIILLQLISSCMFALHFLLLGALIAVLLNIVAMTRAVLFMKYHEWLISYSTDTRALY